MNFGITLVQILRIPEICQLTSRNISKIKMGVLLHPVLLYSSQWYSVYLTPVR